MYCLRRYKYSRKNDAFPQPYLVFHVWLMFSEYELQIFIYLQVLPILMIQFIFNQYFQVMSSLGFQNVKTPTKIQNSKSGWSKVKR